MVVHAQAWCSQLGGVLLECMRAASGCTGPSLQGLWGSGVAAAAAAAAAALVIAAARVHLSDSISTLGGYQTQQRLLMLGGLLRFGELLLRGVPKCCPLASVHGP
jgi:hypothetical protein